MSRCFLQLKERALTKKLRFQCPFKTINRVTLSNNSKNNKCDIRW